MALGEALRPIAGACIDVSDGLYVDLARLAAASDCGAWLDVDRLPISAALRVVDGEAAWRTALQGGEDYELCFAAAPDRAAELGALSLRLGIALARCGQLRNQEGLELRRGANVIQFSPLPFDHFGQ